VKLSASLRKLSWATAVLISLWVVVAGWLMWCATQSQQQRENWQRWAEEIPQDLRQIEIATALCAKAHGYLPGTHLPLSQWMPYVPVDAPQRLREGGLDSFGRAYGPQGVLRLAQPNESTLKQLEQAGISLLVR
jgi:hypothetical protein